MIRYSMTLIKTAFMVLIITCGIAVCDETNLSFCPENKTTDWIQHSSSDGIISFTKSLKDSSLTGYKGICIIESPIDVVYSVLADVPGHSTWIKFCAESKTIKSISPNASIHYYNFDIPWPFINRDIVVSTSTENDTVYGVITINSHALKEPVVPIRKSHLRITDSNHKWTLEKIAPNKTKVTFISMTSLQGAVPTFLNTLISRTIPDSTLKTLKEIASSPNHSKEPRFIADTKSEKNSDQGFF